MRLGRGAEPIVHKTEFDFEIGKAITIREGTDFTIIANGICVMASIRAARKLEKQDGVSTRIIDMHTVKPLDTGVIVKAAEETGKIITVEEHSIVGGLGGAVAETLADAGLGVKFKRLGIPDIYSVIGQPDDLYERYGLDDNGIYAAAKEVLGIA
jgi:transketolase